MFMFWCSPEGRLPGNSFYDCFPTEIETKLNGLLFCHGSRIQNIAFKAKCVAMSGMAHMLKLIEQMFLICIDLP